MASTARYLRGWVGTTAAWLLVAAPSVAFAEEAAGARLATALPPEPAAAGEGGLHDAPLEPPTGERRTFALSYNPLTILLGRVSLNLEVVPVSHHALVFSPFYASTTTNEDSLSNVFRGAGGELGYRYYSGHDGPRGLYIGPSFLAGFYSAIPANGSTVSFNNLGLALDLGYQAIVADRWVVGLGGGLQYTLPSVSFPPQELPASVYAARGLRPRLLLALGVAF